MILKEHHMGYSISSQFLITIKETVHPKSEIQALTTHCHD